MSEVDLSSIKHVAFKFSQTEHASSLLNDGNVYLSTLHEFRDPDRYTGKIVDTGEGKVTLVSYYERFGGFAKDAYGVVAGLTPPYKQILLHKREVSWEFDYPDRYIYCTASKLFSDSLQWAMEEGKEACVLIVDFSRFADVVTKATGLFCTGHAPCQYVGRYIRDENPNKESLTTYYSTNKAEISLIKPKEYAEQRELRAVWEPKTEVLMPMSLNLEEVKELLLPVDVSRLDFEAALRKDSYYGVCVHRKDGRHPSLIRMGKEYGFMTPLVHTWNGVECLGFNPSPDAQPGKDGLVQNAELIFDENVAIFANEPIENIDRIEYFHSDRPAKI